MSARVFETLAGTHGAADECQYSFIKIRKETYEIKANVPSADLRIEFKLNTVLSQTVVMTLSALWFGDLSPVEEVCIGRLKRVNYQV